MKVNVLIVTICCLLLINTGLLICIIMIKDKFCATRNYGGLKKMNLRIIQGTQADTGKYPYAVALVWIIDNTRTPFCGGAIVSNNWVLTAKHCEYTLQRFGISSDDVVAVGNSNNYTIGIVHQLDKFVFYEPDDNNDIDILLMRVKTPFTNTHEKPIDIAGSGYTYKANKIVTIMGWGNIDRDIGIMSEVLHETNVQLYTHERCQNILDNAVLHEEPLPKFTELFFCAGPSKIHSSADSCNGDSGGPVVDKNLLIGIVSWGVQDKRLPCGVGYPGVYVSVWKYESWIHSVQEKEKEKIATIKIEPS